MLYATPEFCTELEGSKSAWYAQEAGIRQGCPLSPFLFLIVMSVIFYDLHQKDTSNILNSRIEGLAEDEVLYADDTILFSTDTKAMNRMIARIESESHKYGLQLNYGKCELVHNFPHANVHFQDGTPLKRVQEAKYLGCDLNERANIRKELNKRMGKCRTVLQKLHVFWRHSDCSVRFKIQVADAVIRSKLLYGLDSAELLPGDIRKLQTLQLKIYRKILHMDTTYVSRQNTNEQVFRRANQAILHATTRKPPKPICPFEEYYRSMKLKRITRTLRARNSDPLHASTLTTTGQPITYSNKRVGRPKRKWAESALQQYWQEHREHIQQYMQHPTDTLDTKDASHTMALQTYARA